MSSRLYKILFFLSILAVVIGMAAFLLSYKQPKDLEIDYLDVGQGDAALIKTPYGQNILVDGGPNSTVLRRLGENLPWWDRTIDLMILTHPHDDHVGGLVDVAKRYKIKKVLYTGVLHTAPAFLEWLQILRDKKIPVTIIDREQTIGLGENLKIEIFYPQKSLAGTTVPELNDSSIVLQLIYGDNKFLFPADISTNVEKELLDKGEVVASDVLKVSHHGSEYATSDESLELVKPEYAVISVGKNNLFGHPNQRTLNKLERAGIKIYRTDELGTIKLKSDGKNIKTNP